MKEKRPTISPNFNFLGQLLDFEKKIKNPREVEFRCKQAEEPAEEFSEDGERSCPDSPSTVRIEALSMVAPLEPLTIPCVLAGVPEEQLLAQALCSLQLGEGLEDSARLKRSFSLDIKSYGEPSPPARESGGYAPDYYKPSSFKDPAAKPCQFSPVQEVSEQSTPEQSPDKEQVDCPTSKSNNINLPTKSQSTASKPPPPPPAARPQPLHRSGSMEETPSTTSFLLGLSRSQQQLTKDGLGALKGWHSDILLGSMAVSSSSVSGGGWYLSSESARFYSTSAIFSSGSGGGGAQSSFAAAYSCSQGLEAVRRRGRQRSGDHGDSRRSWHEESSFEKQLKRRSCQMEFGDGMTESRSREELVKVGSQSSFSGSMEIIEVS